jgi:hypothetical protein
VRRGFKRVAMPAMAQQPSETLSFPAPVRGWVANEGLATSLPAGAAVLENWFPTQTGIRLRGGLLKFATIHASAAVAAMFTYVSGATKKLFASTSDSIFNITSVADPSTPPAADVTGLTNGNFSAEQMNTAGGNYLYAVNGSDSARLYNGTNWSTITGVSAPIAITGVTTSTLSHVWKYRSRLFFIQTGTLKAWALPVNSVGGAAIEIDLSGVFRNGGNLLSGATWSQDAGDGIDDRCVFISDRGEVAIYEGADPSDANDWALVGRYDITPIMGKLATMQIGGDLLIATRDGVVPISQVIAKDPAALSLAAITRSIEPEWAKEVIARSGLSWQLIKFPDLNMGIVSLPNSSTTSAYCFVVNLETGAWAKYTGWDTNCLALHDNWGYFGTKTGKIYKMEIGGSDDGTVYTAKYCGLPDHLGAIGFEKTIHMARATFLAGTAFIPKLSFGTNYSTAFPSAPSSAADSSSDLWDVGLWDQALWDSASPVAIAASTRWVSIGASGYVHAPQLQITCGVTPTPLVELAQIDVIFGRGEVML